jgi:hypothetical protein
VFGAVAMPFAPWHVAHMPDFVLPAPASAASAPVAASQSAVAESSAAVRMREDLPASGGPLRERSPFGEGSPCGE